MTTPIPTPADMLADAERAEQLAVVATPTPWFAKGEGICCGVYQGSPDNQGVPIDLDDPTWNDAAFIAASRELVPLLVSHVKAAVADAGALRARIAELEVEAERLKQLINCPHNDDWFEGVRIEAAYQQERWSKTSDDGKEPQDWFWLLGFLAGKVLRAEIDGDMEKAKHHTISSAAALLNWYRRIAGHSGDMRPGIESPAALLANPESK